MNIGDPWPDLDEAEHRVLVMQVKLHQWATSDPVRRFDDLFNLVSDPAFLVVAWNRVRANKGARSAGVDGVAPSSIVLGAGELLNKLRDDLKARRFSPTRVRETMIPKANGKLRRLGTATRAPGDPGEAGIVLHVDPFRLRFLRVLAVFVQLDRVDPLVLDDFLDEAVVGAPKEIVGVPAVDDPGYRPEPSLKLIEEARLGEQKRPGVRASGIREAPRGNISLSWQLSLRPKCVARRPSSRCGRGAAGRRAIACPRPGRRSTPRAAKLYVTAKPTSTVVMSPLTLTRARSPGDEPVDAGQSAVPVPKALPDRGHLRRNGRAMCIGVRPPLVLSFTPQHVSVRREWCHTVNATLQLEPADLDRYRGVFASVPELTVNEGTEDRVAAGDQHRPLTLLARPPAGVDPTLAAERLARDVRKGAVGLVVARAIPYKERDALEAAGLSWCDGRGALHLSWPGTLIHIDHSGRRRLANEIVGEAEPRLGPAGIRTVQVLLGGTADEWTVNRLADQARISVGQAHNVFRAMEQHRLVQTVGKGPKQRRVINDRGAALDWLAAIDGARRRPQGVATYLYARSEQEIARRFADRASAAGVIYAVTGAAGSQLLGVPVLNRIIVTQVRISGLQPVEALGRLGLEPLDADDAGRGMNLELWSDIGEVGTFAAAPIDGIGVAPPVRVWLDLLRQGGRNRDAAQIFREQSLERT